MDLEYLIETNRQHRYNLLIWLYGQTQANSQINKDLRAYSRSHNLPIADFEKAYHFLCSKGLIVPNRSGYNSFITHYGIKAVEICHKFPSRCKRYFPALRG